MEIKLLIIFRIVLQTVVAQQKLISGSIKEKDSKYSILMQFLVMVSLKLKSLITTFF